MHVTFIKSNVIFTQMNVMFSQIHVLKACFVAQIESVSQSMSSAMATMTVETTAMKLTVIIKQKKNIFQIILLLT